MKLDFTGILEIIFPSTNDERAIKECTPQKFSGKLCLRCKDAICALSSFADPQVRSAIHLNKFHAHPHAKALLSALLKEYFLQVPSKEYFIIPIPLSAKRKKERGYNQVTEVALDALSSLPQMALNTDILYRPVHTLPQTTLSKKERISNMKGAFAITPDRERHLTGAHIVLLDDVTTTGATLKEAKAALLPHHPSSVTCIAFAG